MALIRAAIVVLALLPPVRPPDHVGHVLYYGPGVMERMARKRNAPPAPCYVSYTLARDQDMARLWLRIEGPAGTITCMVVDLPDDSKGHRGPLVAREVWAEVGWRQRWICGPRWTGRARDCKVKVWRLN